MLRANLQYFNVDHAVRSVVVTSAAPGDGKSTVAWNLALAAASAGVRVLLIEADLRHPSLAASAEHLHPAPGLSTVLAGQTELVDAVQTISLDQSSDVSTAGRTLEVLAAGPIPPNPVDLIESQRMREVLRQTENAYALVVIDTSPTLLVPDAVPLLKEVSGVLVVTRLGKNTGAMTSTSFETSSTTSMPERSESWSMGYGSVAPVDTATVWLRVLR